MIKLKFQIRLISSIVFLLTTHGLLFAGDEYMHKGGDFEIDDPTFAEYKIDLNNNGAKETVKITFGPGVSSRPLKIEIFDKGKLLDTLNNDFGIQANYKIEDMDGDGVQEIIIWSGLWDFRMPGENGVTDDNYEGHSAPHRYVVATYKFLRDKYWLWDVYTTKKKYEPFVEEQPME